MDIVDDLRVNEVTEYAAQRAADEIEALRAEVERLREAYGMLDEFIVHIGTPGTEPLNSINGYRDKASRGHFTAQLRLDARNAVANARAALAEKE